MTLAYDEGWLRKSPLIESLVARTLYNNPALGRPQFLWCPTDDETTHLRERVTGAIASPVGGASVWPGGIKNTSLSGDKHLRWSSVFGLTRNVLGFIGVTVINTTQKGAFMKVGGGSDGYGVGAGSTVNWMQELGTYGLTLREGIAWNNSAANIWTTTGFHRIVFGRTTDNNWVTDISKPMQADRAQYGAGSITDDESKIKTPTTYTYINGYTGSAAEDRNASARVHVVALWNASLSDAGYSAASEYLRNAWLPIGKHYEQMLYA